MIRSDVRRDPATQEQLSQDQQHVVRADPAGHYRGQTLARVLVEHSENPKGPSVVRPICHEVIRPDVMAVCGPEPEARPISAPQSGSLRLLVRHLEAFVPPNRIHAILSHVPALASQEIRHRTVAVPPILLGEGDDPLAQPRSLVIRLRHVPRGGPDLADRPTRSTLGHLEHRDGVPHGFAPAGRA